jgi:hypothetical protein
MPALTYQTSVITDDERLRLEVLSIPVSTISTVSTEPMDVALWAEQLVKDADWNIVARATFGEHETAVAPGRTTGSLMDAVVASVTVHAAAAAFALAGPTEEGSEEFVPSAFDPLTLGYYFDEVAAYLDTNPEVAEFVRFVNDEQVFVLRNSPGHLVPGTGIVAGGAGAATTVIYVVGHMGLVGLVVVPGGVFLLGAATVAVPVFGRWLAKKLHVEE